MDRNTYTIRQWTSQHPPIHEPGLRGVLRIARDGIGAGDGANARSPNLFFSTDINQCILDAQIIFLCVDIPTKTSGTGAGAAPDLTALVQATKSIANAAKPGTIIVEKSTVPCGTAREIKEMVSL